MKSSISPVKVYLRKVEDVGTGENGRGRVTVDWEFIRTFRSTEAASIFVKTSQKLYAKGQLVIIEKEDAVVEDDNYEKRVRAYEAEGMTRSDAQAVVDAEDI